MTDAHNPIYQPAIETIEEEYGHGKKVAEAVV